MTIAKKLGYTLAIATVRRTGHEKFDQHSHDVGAPGP